MNELCVKFIGVNPTNLLFTRCRHGVVCETQTTAGAARWREHAANII
jgi:hypothetical protein